MGEGVTIDGDEPAHIKWVHDKALARAEEYGIQGVNYRLTQGKVKLKSLVLNQLKFHSLSRPVCYSVNQYFSSFAL